MVRRCLLDSTSKLRQPVTAAADPPSVAKFFRGLLAAPIRPPDPLLQAAEGIREAIAAGNANEALIAGFVDTLASARQPFDEQQLGGGPWQARVFLPPCAMMQHQQQQPIKKSTWQDCL